MSESPTISVAELRSRLALGAQLTVLDIRTAGERAEWSIPGSLHADLYAAVGADEMDGLDRLQLPRETPVVVVCAAGRTSRIATDHLRARGIPARSLVGGMRAWSLAWNTAEVALPEPDLQVLQIRRTGKGCLSYLLARDGEAAVVDASLDPGVYRRLAEERGLAIRAVLDTHLHADHWSRSRLLARATGAAYYLPRQERIAFDATLLDDGDTVPLGSSRIAVLHTPGHTWESSCYLAGESVLLTGDTLFLGALGRPDLEAAPEEGRQRALALHGSLQRIADLPGKLWVLPGHTAEPVPFDGRPLGAPLAEALAGVPLIGLNAEAFAVRLLRRVPPAPANHHRIVQLNESGVVPEEDPAELEAGANRCAVS